MGYYIQTPGTHKGKAKRILEILPSAIIATHDEARHALDDPTLGVIVVVNSGPFEAAAFAYSIGEWYTFHRPGDLRPRTYIIADREEVKKAINRTGD